MRKHNEEGVLLLAMALAFLSATAFADLRPQSHTGNPIPLSPYWQDENTYGPMLDRNSTYLDDLEYGSEEKSFTVDEINGHQVLDDRSTIKIRNEYEILVYEHEQRRNYDQADIASEHRFMDRLHKLGKYALRTLLSFQVKEQLKKAEKNSQEIRTFRSVQQNVQNVVQGKMSVKVNDSFKVGTRTDIPNQRGTVWMESVLFNSNLDYQAGRLDLKYDPWSLSDERYRVRIDRDAFWGIRSELIYGGSTTNVTASISKDLNDYLRFVVSSSRAIEENRTNLPSGGEETVRLMYGVHF